MTRMTHESSKVDLLTFFYALGNLSPAISDLLFNNLILKSSYDHTLVVPIKG